MDKTIKNPPVKVKGQHHTIDYLKLIGVPEILPATSPFDPGYDPATFESHLDQSAHLMSILKISMACWMVANEYSTRRKVAAAKRHKVPTVTGGGPFEWRWHKNNFQPISIFARTSALRASSAVRASRK